MFWKNGTGSWSGPTLIQPPVADYSEAWGGFGASVSLSGDGTLLAVLAPVTPDGGEARWRNRMITMVYDEDTRSIKGETHKTAQTGTC